MAEDGRDQTYPLNLVQEVLCWYPERAGRKACPLKERGPRYKLNTVEDEKSASFDFVKCDSVRPQVMVSYRQPSVILIFNHFLLICIISVFIGVS